MKDHVVLKRGSDAEHGYAQSEAFQGLTIRRGQFGDLQQQWALRKAQKWLLVCVYWFQHLPGGVRRRPGGAVNHSIIISKPLPSSAKANCDLAAAAGNGHTYSETCPRP
jgi:hypothetical protein